MSVKLLTEHHLEFLSLKGGCRGSSESTLVKMPHCWISHAAAQLFVYNFPLDKDILVNIKTNVVGTQKTLPYKRPKTYLKIDNHNFTCLGHELMKSVVKSLIE